ncbi:uncharacterized protein LOC114932380 [Nylanderia fulva]|uniref:uncharacterized protein LOC114932380 n=1 Tax=Nylanderia fulva TaxID=613905 RepID=UPI0010FB5423|nr:uncharacterized protein LOC114932380 [Nylanderia fulva]
MSTPGNNFTVVELKSALRARGLPSEGAKAELIQRLEKIGDPGVWAELNKRPEGQRSAGASRPEMESEMGETLAEDDLLEEFAAEETALERTAARRDAVVRGHEGASSAFLGNLERAELNLLRREKDLWERERSFFQRERELLRGSSVASTGSSGGESFRGVKELLPEFDGSENTFWRWRSQLGLLRDTYRLDEGATRILIGYRLKGRALTWFYSKTEHLAMGMEELLEEMARMFDLRPARITLRRKFEARMWRGDEPFSNYYHEKVILANRVPVAEDELIDHVIEGITNVQLRNQARLMRFRSGAELLEAFESIVFERRDRMMGPPGGARPAVGEGLGAALGPGRAEIRGDRVRPDADGGAGRPGLERTRCFRCGEVGHIAARCGRQPTGRACYVCGASGHLAAGCPGRGRPAVAGPTAGSTEIGLADAVRPAAFPGPYMVSVDILAADEGADFNYTDDAVVDSGSPISLIRSSNVPGKLCSLVDQSANQFHGINGSLLRVNSIFYSIVKVCGVQIKIKFYTVPDDAMMYNVLLGRDFLMCPSIRVTFGETVKIVAIEEPSTFGEIMMIESGDVSVNMCGELRIDEGIGEKSVREISEAHEACYLDCLRAESGAPNFEMTIALKHEQPIASRPRRLSFADKEALCGILDRRLSDGTIRHSDSPYASPIVLVRKKDGSIRLCIDYRELNKITVRDNFPTELIDDNIDRLRSKKYFSISGLKDGFHHVRMHPASIKYASFVTPLGQFEWLRMPFGLTNAPRVFQRFIHMVFVKIRDELGKSEIKYYELRDGLAYRKDKNGKVYWFPRRRDKVKGYGDTTAI